MSPSEKVRALLDERGIEHDDNDANMEVTGVRITKWDNGGKREVRYEEWRNGTTRLDAGNVSPEQAIAATVGGGITLDEATEYAERFMGDYAKVLLASTLYVERDEPTDQHSFDVAEQKEVQMARTLAEALATVVVGTCKLVDNDSGPDMHCTACGGGVDDEYRYFMDSWGYSRCPHCGSRIIEED